MAAKKRENPWAWDEKRYAERGLVAIKVRVDEEVADALEELQKRERKSKSEIVAELILRAFRALR